MAKTATVTLGGREYVIREKPMGASILWRKRLRESNVYRIVDSLEDSLAVIFAAADNVVGSGKEDRDWAQMIRAVQIVPVLANGLLSASDDVWDLLFAYSPEIKADEEWIKENSYDEEGMTAFIELLKIAFPFLALWDLLAPGSRARRTHTNSVSQNGGSGLPASGPQRKASTSSLTATSGASAGKRKR